MKRENKLRQQKTKDFLDNRDFELVGFVFSPQHLKVSDSLAK